MPKNSVCIGAYLQHSGIWQLCFSLHFLLAQGFKVSHRREFRAFFCFWTVVFSELVHSPTHVHSLLDSLEYVRAFQSYLWISHSPVFPLKSFLVSWLCALLCTASGICDVKQLPLIIFNECPQRRDVFALDRPQFK